MNRTTIRTTTILLAATMLAAVPISAAVSLGPGAPQNLTATAGPGSGTISLSWGAASSLTGVTSYKVYHVNADSTFTLVGSTDGATLSYTETGLGNGVTVTYVVTAVDITGEGPASNQASATTFALPSAPQGVTATPGAVGTVGDLTVAWSAPASDGGSAVTGYNVYVNGQLAGSTDAATLSLTLHGEQALTDYHVQVSAVNGVGEGALSDAVCGMASPWGFGLGEPSCLGLM